MNAGNECIRVKNSGALKKKCNSGEVALDKGQD